jgi:hypothetical protein
MDAQLDAELVHRGRRLLAESTKRMNKLSEAWGAWSRSHDPTGTKAIAFIAEHAIAEEGIANDYYRALESGVIVGT